MNVPNCYELNYWIVFYCMYSATSLKSRTFAFFDIFTYFVKYLLNHTSQ